MSKQQKIILVIAIAAIVGYFIWANNKPATGAGATIPTTPGDTSNSPGSSLPSPVSVPNPVSQQGGGLTIPVAIPSVPTTFAPSTSDAQVNGSGTTSDPTSGLPSGFIAWYNSLGVQNRNRVATLIPTLTGDEINLVNNIVTNNLWGNPSIAPQWNAFTLKYKLPVSGNFSNFQSR